MRKTSSVSSRIPFGVRDVLAEDLDALVLERFERGHGLLCPKP